MIANANESNSLGVCPREVVSGKDSKAQAKRVYESSGRDSTEAGVGYLSDFVGGFSFGSSELPPIKPAPV